MNGEPRPDLEAQAIIDAGIVAQEEFDGYVDATVNYWRLMSGNSERIKEEIDMVVTDHMADTYQFAEGALIAYLQGDIISFMESQLRSLATLEVENGRD